MIFNDLREFIKRVEELGELKVVEGADWNLEIGAITDWQSEPGKPMLLFDKIKEYEPGYRVVSNLTASAKRLCMVMGLPDVEKPMDMIKAWRDKTKGEIKPIPPVEVEKAPIKENVYTGDDVDLFKFPTPKWNELDGGRYIGTGHIVIARDPDEGWVNLGTYRSQIQDRTTTTIYAHEGQHFDIIRKKYWAKGQACPTAISCGQDPQLWFLSTIAVPWGVSEYDYHGWLRNKPVEVTRGVYTDLPIPATSEIVLEGDMVPPEVETRMEGPFAEWSGYYAGPVQPRAAFRVKAVLHRNNPILMGCPVESRGVTPLYDFGRMIQRSAQLWEFLEREVGGVTGVWIAPDATAAMIPIISIKQAYSGHSKRVAMAAKVTKATAFTSRFVIVVDDDIDPSNMSEVIWAIGTRCDPETAIEIIRGCWTAGYDPLLSPIKREHNEITKSVAIIDACKPYHWIDQFPRPIKTSDEYMNKIKAKWGNVLT